MQITIVLNANNLEEALAMVPEATDMARRAADEPEGARICRYMGDLQVTVVKQ